MLDGDDWNDDLLRHGSAMYEAGASHEMEQVRSLGNPEVHIAVGLGGDTGLAMPGSVVIREIGSKQVALLGQNGVVWLVIQFALVRLNPSSFREEKAVVSRDKNVVAIQAVDDVADQSSQLAYRLPHGFKSVSLGLAVVADRVDRQPER